jgi:ribosomal protein L14
VTTVAAFLRVNGYRLKFDDNRCLLVSGRRV